MIQVKIRQASHEDYRIVGLLHAESWKKTYRNILPDSYLDNNLEKERITYWSKKLAGLTSKEFVLIAETDEGAQGFIALLDKPEVGCDAFIDNLHVRPNLKGMGIGSHLMRTASERLLESGRHSVYLWVLEGNTPAEKFYKSKGATTEDVTVVKFGGHEVRQTRFVWKTLEPLLR